MSDPLLDKFEQLAVACEKEAQHFDVDWLNDVADALREAKALLERAGPSGEEVARSVRPVRIHPPQG